MNAGAISEEQALCRWCGVRLVSYQTTWHWVHVGGYLHCKDTWGATIWPQRRGEPTVWREARAVEVCINCGQEISRGAEENSRWAHTTGRFFCGKGDGGHGARLLATPPEWTDAELCDGDCGGACCW